MRESIALDWHHKSLKEENTRTSPRTRGSSLVFSKNLTATSPVTTPRPSVSACRNSCPNTRFSSGVRFRLGAAVCVHPSASSSYNQMNGKREAVLPHLRSTLRRPPLSSSPRESRLPRITPLKRAQCSTQGTKRSSHLDLPPWRFCPVEPPRVEGGAGRSTSVQNRTGTVPSINKQSPRRLLSAGQKPSEAKSNSQHSGR